MILSDGACCGSHRDRSLLHPFHKVSACLHRAHYCCSFFSAARRLGRRYGWLVVHRRLAPTHPRPSNVERRGGGREALNDGPWDSVGEGRRPIVYPCAIGGAAATARPSQRTTTLRYLVAVPASVALVLTGKWGCCRREGPGRGSGQCHPLSGWVGAPPPRKLRPAPHGHRRPSLALQKAWEAYLVVFSEEDELTESMQPKLRSAIAP